MLLLTHSNTPPKQTKPSTHALQHTNTNTNYHHQVRLSPEVTRADCEAAMDLLAFALYHEGDERHGQEVQHVIPPTAGAETEGEESDGDDGDDDGEDGDAPAGGKRRRATAVSKKQQQQRRQPRPEGGEEEEEFGDDDEGSTTGRGAHSPATTDEEEAGGNSSKRPRRAAGASKEAEGRSALFVGRLSRELAARLDGVQLDAFLETVRPACLPDGRTGSGVLVGRVGGWPCLFPSSTVLVGQFPCDWCGADRVNSFFLYATTAERGAGRRGPGGGAVLGRRGAGHRDGPGRPGEALLGGGGAGHLPLVKKKRRIEGEEEGVGVGLAGGQAGWRFCSFIHRVSP